MVDIEQVLNEFRPVLGRTAAMYAPPGSDRDDLLQEIYLALLSALPRYRGRELASDLCPARGAQLRGPAHRAPPQRRHAARRRRPREPGARPRSGGASSTGRGAARDGGA